MADNFGPTTERLYSQNLLRRQDGVTNRKFAILQALIYALQAEEGMPPDVANANFGETTRLCCPEIPYFGRSTDARKYPGTSSGSYYSNAEITSITELLQLESITGKWH